MLAWFRAGLVAALFLVLATPTEAAEKTFQDDALDDAAITLQADLKDEAGTVDKPLIKLKQGRRRGCSRAQDLDSAADIYVQIVTVAPNDAAAWRRLADLWLKIPTTDEDDGSTRYERATHGGLYRLSARDQRAGRGRCARSCSPAPTASASEWRSGAERAEARAQAARDARPQDAPMTACARNTASASPTSASTSTPPRPRACFQFSESLPKRTDFSPFVAVAGQDKPALSVDDQQLCVEGLKHGESYSITLREGLPSTVGEDLLKTADFNIYVRDRSPLVRLAGKAYVLPKTGQQGIPLVSVNTDTIKVTIYRIGDRNLVDTVLGYDFERNLYGYSLDEHRRPEGRAGLDRRD